jgi:hypothetical protein
MHMYKGRPRAALVKYSCEPMYGNIRALEEAFAQ